ncbi:hypothetical protein PYW08_011448 [Mythimna loreyi]|uniref:Uncharacterized protein n=1 Tax=Mythimna loreyi TaxID=667449 RepID=A0ACC2QKE6_9NEOP|nr:hypothetical protein PYW08_011448 [Mythimna loreyi]
MDRTNLDKSLSETDLDRVGLQNPDHTTPPNFVVSRQKRKRENDFVEELAKFKEEMQSMFSNMMAAQEKEFKKNSIILQGIQQSSCNIDSSIIFLTEQNEEFKKKIVSLEDKIKEDKKYIILLEDKIETMQQDNRKANFELKNVPKKSNETKDDLIHMVVSLSNSVGYPIDKSVISDIYRVRTKKEARNTPIVVETNSAIIKNNILKSCKAFNTKQKLKLCAKHLDIRTNEDTPIFITEQLTAKAARLHFLARDLVKSKSYKYCWTSYGRVYLKREDDSPSILIKTEAQIHQLIINQ